MFITELLSLNGCINLTACVNIGAFIVNYRNAKTSVVEKALGDILKLAPHRRGGDKYKVNIPALYALVFANEC